MLFGESVFFACVDDGCYHHSLYQLSGLVHSLEDEIKILSDEGRNIYNNIIVARIWCKIDGYTLPILVLLETLNDSKDFHIALEQYPFFKKE